MDSLLAARIQMEVSFAFHMIFAAFGVGMPLFMLIAEWRWLKTGEEHYLQLAKRWGKAIVVLFAIGAVSGTALSFELGLLWPTFMEFAGGVIGPAFALEAFAFFVEAIFLALYLFGWKRLSPWAHWWTGVPVAIAGAASSVLVVATNAWMQNPVGLEEVLANPEAIDPIRMLFFDNPMWKMMAIHSTLATYAATAFSIAGIYAFLALRGRRTRRTLSGLRMAMGVGLVIAILMPITGHIYTQVVGEIQPAKLAAMEGHYVTDSGVPLTIGGWPNSEEQRVRYGIQIPKLLSFMLHNDPNAEVIGLDQFERSDWPHVPITRTAFQLMVASGFAMLFIAVWFWYTYRRKRDELMHDTWLMRALLIGSPLGFLGLQTGWIVTEAGRQPWVIYNFMRTANAVTDSDGVLATLIGYSVLYLFLTAALIWLLVRMARHEASASVKGG